MLGAGINPMVYLDNAASTPITLGVKEKLISLLDIYGNPSSQHDLGYKAKAIIDEAGIEISNKLHCDIDEIHYITGTTMGNNLLIRGFFKANPHGILITDKLEHQDIIMLAKEYKDQTYMLSNDSYGFVNLKMLEQILRVHTAVPVLVSIQMANNEIGTIQYIKSIARIVDLYKNAYLHMDATQYIAWYSVDLSKLKIDALTMSGQKIGCIKGTGLLYIRKNTPIASIILGEQGFIGGTENVLGIGCLGQAFKELDWGKSKECMTKRDYFNTLLSYELNGAYGAGRLPNNLNLQFPGCNSDEFVELLNQNGVYASAGSACSSYSNVSSHVLKAIGLTEEEASSSVRFTLNNQTTYEELNEAAKIINNVYELTRKKV